MALAQVFKTAELLEMILYKLPVKDLLFAQRVARQWKAVTDNSVKLQQGLFFTPIPCDPLPSPKVPRLAKMDEYQQFQKHMRRQRGNCMLHPLLEDVLISMRFPDQERDSLKESITERLPMEAFRYEEASWKRMLFNQPRVKDSFRAELCDRYEGRLYRTNISSGSECFSRDIIEILECQVCQGDWLREGWVSLYACKRLAFGTHLECCDELEDLIKHAKRKEELEASGGVSEK